MPATNPASCLDSRTSSVELGAELDEAAVEPLQLGRHSTEPAIPGHSTPTVRLAGSASCQDDDVIAARHEPLGERLPEGARPSRDDHARRTWMLRGDPGGPGR